MIWLLDTLFVGVPTPEWQDRLANWLASPTATSSIPNSYSSSVSPSPYGYPAKPVSLPLSEAPAPQRRRLNDYTNPVSPEPNWNGMYTFDPVPGGKRITLLHFAISSEMRSDEDERGSADSTADGVGQLSLDEDHQVILVLFPPYSYSLPLSDCCA